jgi:hypothetical protein
MSSGDSTFVHVIGGKQTRICRDARPVGVPGDHLLQLLLIGLEVAK